jgi:hypothetical protein
MIGWFHDDSGNTITPTPWILLPQDKMLLLAAGESVSDLETRNRRGAPLPFGGATNLEAVIF